MVHIHAAEEQEHVQNERHDDINAVQDHRGIAHFRDELSLSGTRHLRAHEVHILSARKRQNRKDKDEYSHTSDPMRKATPEEK